MPKTVNLTWNNASSGITEQLVERSVTDGAFVQIGTTLPDQNSFTDNVDEFVGETKLSYKVSSKYNHEGTAYSASSSVFDIVINQSTTFVEPMLVTPSTSTISISSASDLEIDWGDGTIQTVKSGDDTTHSQLGLISNKYTHTYTDSYEDKTISIKHVDGESPIQYFSSNGIKTVQRWYSEGYQPFKLFNASISIDIDMAFYGLGQQLETVPNIAPPKTTHLSGMFMDTSIFNQDISLWDVSNVTNLAYTFGEAQNFNQPLSAWDVSKVTNMQSMFYQAAAFNQDISGWVVSNVTDMTRLFHSAEAFNQDISGWNVSKVTKMGTMFYGANAFNQPIGSWDVSNVTDMSEMFQNIQTFNQDISSWNVSNVTNMEGMFFYAIAFNQDLSQWCVSNIAAEPNNFAANATNWTLPRPVWGTCPRGENIPDSDFTKATYVKTDTSNPMWIETEYAPENINGKLHIDWGDGTKEVLNISDFEADGYCISLEHEYAVNGEYVVKVYSTTKANYTVFGEITKVTDWGSPSNLQPLFHSNNLIEVPSTLHPELTSLQNMFGSCNIFNQDISSWNVSNVANMIDMFNGASAFNQDIGNWDVSNVIDMERMFHYASAFNQDLSQWCVSNITQEPYNFSDSSPLTTQHKPRWGTCPVKPEDGEIPSNEMHFTTTAGTIGYVGTQGDQILLSDGTTVDIVVTDEAVSFIAPAGKHKVKLVESTDRSNYVSVGGEALVELHNFPTLSTIDSFDFYPNSSSPNLVKVPTILPSNLTSIAWMFCEATSFNQDISMWDVSNVINMSNIFAYATSFNQDISMWDTSNVTEMVGVFNYATSFNQDISMWDVSKVMYMVAMFEGAEAFNQDLSQWCVPLISTLPGSFATNSALIADNFPVWGTCPSSSGGIDEPISQWRTMNELKLLTDVGEFRGYYSGFGAPSGHTLFLDMLNNYQETKASFYTYGADQLIGEVDLTEYLPTLKQLITDYPTGFNAGTNMWYTDIYKNKDVSDMSPQFQILIEAIADHFGVWTGLSTITLQFEGQSGRLASGEFYMLGVLRLHFTMYTLREGESTQYLDIFVESVVAPSNNFTLYSRSRQTVDWGNLLKTAAEIEGTSEEVMLKDNGGTSTIVLKELGHITRR